MRWLLTNILVLLTAWLANAQTIVEGGSGGSGGGQTQGDTVVSGVLTVVQHGISVEMGGKTTGNITLYVETTGNDSNDCLSSGSPCLTIQEAVDRIPQSIAHEVTINIGAGSFPAVSVSGFILQGIGKFFIQGALGAPTVTTGTTTGTATGGSTVSVVDSGQSWTGDDLIGYFVLVAGEHRLIYDNNGTTLFFERPLSDSASGKAYSVLEVKTVLTGTEPRFGYGPVGVGNVLGNRQLYLKNLKVGSGVIGFFVYDCAGVEIYRCATDGAAYGFYAQNTFGDIQFDDCYASNGSYGFFIQNAATRVTSYGLFAESCSVSGFYIEYVLTHVVDYPVAIGCGEGFTASGTSILNFGGTVRFTGNSSHGLNLAGDNREGDVDAGVISNNGGYGVYIDENASGNRKARSFFNMTGSVTIANNTSGGIIAKNNSVVTLTNIDGTGNGNYGLELETSSSALVTSATGITGSSGDATVNDGATTLTWSSDFSSDGDIAVNLGTNCRIERRD